MNSTNLYDEVIALIDAAQTADEATKASMIREIEAHGMSPVMQERVTALFRAEAQKLGIEVDTAEATLAKVIQVKNGEESTIEPLRSGVETDFAKSSAALADETEVLCAREARTVDAAVGTALKERDDSAADSIRKSLMS